MRILKRCIALFSCIGSLGSHLFLATGLCDYNIKTKKLYTYDKHYKNCAATMHSDTAVVIVGFNRPEYFGRVLKALEANPESQTLPFFFILDGGPKAKQKEYRDLINSSTIKNKYTIARPINYGLHWNVISGLRFMFDWCGFEKIIHFEDDVVVTPTYLGLMQRLDNWAHNKYDNIGAVQGFRPCKMSHEEKLDNADVVAEFAGLWLGYCMRKSVWDSIKDIMYEYEEKFLSGKKWEPSRIKSWMTKKLKAPCDIRSQNPERLWRVPLDPYYSKLPQMGVGQCGMLTMSLFLRGYSRLTLMVNRSLNIGVEGANYRRPLWETHFLGMALDQFEQDAVLEDFKPYPAFVY